MKKSGWGARHCAPARCSAYCCWLSLPTSVDALHHPRAVSEAQPAKSLSRQRNQISEPTTSSSLVWRPVADSRHFIASNPDKYGRASENLSTKVILLSQVVCLRSILASILGGNCSFFINMLLEEFSGASENLDAWSAVAVALRVTDGTDQEVIASRADLAAVF